MRSARPRLRWWISARTRISRPEGFRLLLRRYVAGIRVALAATLRPLVTALLLAAVACVPLDPVAKDAGSRPAAPTLGQLANARYTGIFESPVRLRDGRYEGEPFVPGAASAPRMDLVGESWVLADLDADGAGEGVVLLVASSGGSGAVRHLAVVEFREGEARSRATTRVGDRVQPISLEAGEGRIRLELAEHGPGDPACCPSHRAVREWRFEAGTDELVETRHVPRGRISLADLAGGRSGLVLDGEESESLAFVDTPAAEGQSGAPRAAFRRLRGHLALGHEVRSFTPCDSRRGLWVIDRTGSSLVETYRALAVEPYEEVYAELWARSIPAPDEGCGADYDDAVTAPPAKPGASGEPLKAAGRGRSAAP